MIQGQKVKLTKLKTIISNEKALEENYWLIGTLIRDIIGGERIYIWRIENNRGKSEGVFQSSSVKYISVCAGDTIRIVTENSEWKMDYLT